MADHPIPSLTATDGREASLAAIRRRMQQVTAGLSYARIGQLTGCHPETARRQLKSGAPGVELILGLCAAWNINANRLLFGVGPQHGRDLSTHVVCDVRVDALQDLLDSIFAATGRDGLRPPATNGESARAGAARIGVLRSESA